MPNTEKFRFVCWKLACSSNNCSNKPNQASQVRTGLEQDVRTVRICRRCQWSILNAKSLGACLASITIWRPTGRMRICCTPNPSARLPCKVATTQTTSVSSRRLYNNLLSQKDLASERTSYSPPPDFEYVCILSCASHASQHRPLAAVIPRRPISRVFEHILDEKISQSRSRPSFNVNFCGLWPSQ